MAKRADDLIALLSRIQGATGLTSPHIQKAIAESGLDLATATPDEVYRAVTGASLPGPAKPYAPPAPEPQGSGRAAMPPLEQRVVANPAITDPIRMALPAIERVNPELAARIRLDDPEAYMEAFRLITSRRNPFTAAEAAAPPRQMELPINQEGPAPEVPASEPTPLADLPLGGRSFIAPSRSVLMQSDTGVLPSSALFEVRPGQLAMELPSAQRAATVQPSAEDAPVIAQFPSPQRSQASNGRAAAAAALAAAAAGGGYYLTDLLTGERDVAAEPPLVLKDETPIELSGGNTADLAAETSPPPVVRATNEMVYPAGPEPGPRSNRLIESMIADVPYSASEDMTIGGIDPATARVIAAREAAARMDKEISLMDRALQKYNPSNAYRSSRGSLRSPR